MQADYVVVGSGLTGATIARRLADAGREVVVLDRRSHVGGNVRDVAHPSGIRYHAYGPHYFRTACDDVWRFCTRFSEFYPFEAVLVSLIRGRYEHWPIQASYIEREIGADWQPAFIGEPANFEQACLATMPEPIYRLFIKGYTAKQWGVPPERLDATLAGRFSVREEETRLSLHPHQGLPLGGYAGLMVHMLRGIPVMLNCDYLAHHDAIIARRKVIYTGPIDEYYRFDLGKLDYRGQRREHTYVSEADLLQPFVQVNNPDPENGDHIRTIEWKHLMLAEYAERIAGTLLTQETPYTPDEPDRYEYPFPSARNRALYQQYRVRADAEPNLLICGRLGEYRYYDMDHAILAAFEHADRLLAEG